MTKKVKPLKRQLLVINKCYNKNLMLAHKKNGEGRKLKYNDKIILL